VDRGISTVLAAAILGGAVVAGSFVLGSGLDSITEELAVLADAVESAAEAPRPSPAPAPTARRGVDPGRRHTVDTKGSPAKGPEDAKVTIVEFSDFQCPFCSRVLPTLDQIREEYPDEVRVVFKHLPLRMHAKAPAAHAAAEAAHRQGRFWEMHDRIFQNQREMAPERYVEYAQEMGLDVDRFQSDVASSDVKDRVDGDAEQASSLGVSGTPGFFINGRFLSGARPFADFKRMIDEELGRG
jgi:protein-disulfide isomerase